MCEQVRCTCVNRHAHVCMCTVEFEGGTGGSNLWLIAEHLSASLLIVQCSRFMFVYNIYIYICNT